MADRPVPGALETRSAPEAAAPTVEGRRLRGRLPYRTPSKDFGGWREVIEPGALTHARMDDLIANVDHAGLPIGRYPTTLAVEDREDGLHWSVELPESRADVREALDRGDLRATSWRMVVGRDEWRGDTRHVHEITELRDLSVVTTPAYAEARAEYRSAPEPSSPQEPSMTDPRPDTQPDDGGDLPPAARAGTLLVEQRSHEPAGTPETRVMDAIASVPRGELRDLTHANSGPVEPDDLRTVLIDRFREQSVVAASGVPIVATDSKLVKFPLLTGDVTSAFLDELETIPESDPDLDEFEVPVKALKTLVRASAEALEDSTPDLLRLIQSNILTAMALKGDRELVIGNDPKGFPGLVNVAGTQSIAVDGPLTHDHLLDAAGLLAEALIPGPYVALIGPRPLTALGQSKTTDGAYLAPPAGVPAIRSTSWLPVTGVEPTTTAIVFAPGQQMIVMRKQVQVEVDRSAEFADDAVLIRGRYRLGLGVPHPQSVVKLTGLDADPIA